MYKCRRCGKSQKRKPCITLRVRPWNPVAMELGDRVDEWKYCRKCKPTISKVMRLSEENHSPLDLD